MSASPFLTMAMLSYLAAAVLLVYSVLTLSLWAFSQAVFVAAAAEAMRRTGLAMPY